MKFRKLIAVFAAVAVAGGLALATAGPASASPLATTVEDAQQETTTTPVTDTPTPTPVITEGPRCGDFVVDVYTDGKWSSSRPATEAECPSPWQASHDDQRLIEFEVDCDAGVTARYEVWTTNYTFDRVAKVFVANDPVLKDSWTVEREATADEIAENCPDTQEPEALVVTGEWADGEFQCDDTEVEQTREVTTTGYILDGEGRNWVLDTENAVTVSETQTRELTDAETEPCPVVPVAKVTPTAAGLAETGFDGSGLFVALAAITLGLAFGTLAVIRRRSAVSTK